MNHKIKMLITGVSGLLGNNLARYFEKRYEVVGLYNEHPVLIKGIRTDKCDLSDEKSAREMIHRYNPDVIIHSASMTNMDGCEKNPDKTRLVNVSSTRNIVDNITDQDSCLIYISTDSVYDGMKGNYSENDSVNPLNIYGQTKFDGELIVRERQNSLVLRTNLFGWNIQDKKSIAEWILDALMNKQTINGFQDAIFSTIYTMELARVIDVAIRKQLTGVYNCGSSDSCSKYEFALKIAEHFGLNKELICPISLDDFNFEARRGKNLSLNVNNIQRNLDYRLPAIDQSIDEFYRDFKCGMTEEIKKYQSPENSNHVFDFIPYGRQYIDENDIQAVKHVLHSTNLTQGPEITEFESALCRIVDISFAVACNSGTSALHMSCLAAGVGPGDEVITSPITFVASANCAVYCGAKPVFADIESRTYNISPAEIEKKITRKTRAIIPVHFAGQSCDMENIKRIVTEAEKKYEHKIYIIEDACHALGSIYKNTKVGSCAYADMTVTSFHPVKHITTGEGGAIFTEDQELLKKLRLLRSHGITTEPGDFMNHGMAFQSVEQKERNPWYYEQIALGYNYRITDMQCALGLSQLKKLEKFKKRRREVVNTYNSMFSKADYIQTPFETNDCSSNFHLYVLLFDFEKIGMDRATLMTKLKEENIQTQVHYIPVHLQPFYKNNFATNWGDCPNAENYYAKCLSLPLHPTLTDRDVRRVVDEILNFAGRSL